MTASFGSDGSGIALPDFVDTAAAAHPDKIACSFRTEQWTFRRLRQAVAYAASLLAVPGEGDGRVGILSANRLGFVIAVHSAARAEASFVPLNWRQTPDELAWQIRHAGIKTLFVDEERTSTANAACENQSVTIIDISRLEQGAESYGGIAPTPPIPLNREAAVIYTSGTSGRPKGARITYGNFWFAAIGSSLRLGYSGDDVWLAAMPLFHIGGLAMLYRGLIGGNEVVLHNRFDPEMALSAIDNGVTLASLVPTMLRRMIDRRPTPWPKTLRGILLGGGPAPEALLYEALRFGLPVLPTYGLTEATSQVATLDQADVAPRMGSSGLPLPITRVRIVRGAKTVEPGAIGEIEISGPTVFTGYLGETSPHLPTAERWFATGDAGYLDEDGYLYVVDRRDDLIVSGGENVYPAEIERVLLEHPLVRDAGALGLPDEEWGSRPVAAVVWDGTPEHADATLREHCRPRLATFKVPDRVFVVPALPRSPAGKLLRRSLGALIADLDEPPVESRCNDGDQKAT